MTERDRQQGDLVPPAAAATRRAPSRQVCLGLMEAAAMPANIRGHSLVVARVALLVGRRLVAAGVALDLALVEAIALLHDIGKARGLATGEPHGEVGGAMLVEAGYPEIAQAVRDHTRLRPEELDSPFTESLLVNYADKRVRHEEVVSLAERFADLGARYARSPEGFAYLAELLGLYERLEEALFARLDIGPRDLS